MRAEARKSSALAGNKRLDFLDQFLREEWFGEDCVGFGLMRVEQIELEISAIKNCAEIGMRFAATHHEVHAIEGLHHEISDQQFRFGFGGFKRFERIERRGE